MIRRTLPSTAMALLLLGAAFVVVGKPDPGAAARFFAGGVPTLDEAEAVVALFAWTVIAAIAVYCVGGSLRAITRSDIVRQRSRRAGLVLAAGLLLFAVAAVQRSLPASVSVCCGDEASAAQEAANVAR